MPLSHSRFTFDRYSWDPDTRTIRLSYSLDDEIRFTEVLTLPAKPALTGGGNPAVLNRALFSLHLIGGISYYKTCCPPQIEIRSGELNLADRTFWQTVYQNGLGEFFFRNTIDFRGLIHFPINETKPRAIPTVAPTVATKQILVPIGGGKDSMVTIEKLKAAGYAPTLLRIGAHPVIDELAHLSGCPLITIKRQLAPELFDLNTKGALNGHVPITAYLHFLSLVLAELYNFDAVVFSDERSANIGSFEYLGMEINHQWSKSLEFERLAQAYIRTSVGSSKALFSLLRPWSELRITQDFCGLQKYVGKATSCNKNWKISEQLDHSVSRWCGHCPKCAFVYAMMSAWVDPKNLQAIFKKDLYADAELVPLFRDLLGLENFKPFECVGTPEETTAAMYFALQRGYNPKLPVLAMYTAERLPQVPNPQAMAEECLRSSSNHAIPVPFQDTLS